MSYYGSSSSGGRSSRRVDYGRTYVVRPKGRHLATIVWLHGLGDNGVSWSQLLDSPPLPNVSIGALSGLHVGRWEAGLGWVPRVMGRKLAIHSPRLAQVHSADAVGPCRCTPTRRQPACTLA